MFIGFVGCVSSTSNSKITKKILQLKLHTKRGKRTKNTLDTHHKICKNPQKYYEKNRLRFSVDCVGWYCYIAALFSVDAGSAPIADDYRHGDAADSGGAFIRISSAYQREVVR